MTRPTQRSSAIIAVTGFACALTMLGCDSSAPARGTTSTKPDGGGTGPDAKGTDVALGGGGIQGGGNNTGAGSSGGGGTSSASSASGTTGGYGAGVAFGGISGGGGGGNAVGAGGTTGQVGSGSGGVTGAGGISPGQGGANGRDAGRGGAGGTVDAPAGWDATADAKAREVAWWENDAGIKTCPYNIGYDYFAGFCSPGGPSICVVAGTYDPYQCSAAGKWKRQPDSCPKLLVNGDTCTGQFACLYSSGWYCDCSAGMGFPAKCGDVRDTGLLEPRDAGPPVDTRPAALLPCPADYQTGTCDWTIQEKCVQSDGLTACRCYSGTWYCSKRPCSGLVTHGERCDPTLGLKCRDDLERVCDCGGPPPIGLFLCSNR